MSEPFNSALNIFNQLVLSMLFTTSGAKKIAQSAQKSLKKEQNKTLISSKHQIEECCCRGRPHSYQSA